MNVRYCEKDDIKPLFTESTTLLLGPIPFLFIPPLPEESHYPFSFFFDRVDISPLLFNDPEMSSVIVSGVCF